MTIKGNWRYCDGAVIHDTDSVTDPNCVCQFVPSAEIGHLLAAAPDMYRALKAIRDARIFADGKHIKLADAALAKAEGRGK